MRHQWSRRRFLKGMGWGLAGAAVGGASLSKAALPALGHHFIQGRAYKAPAAPARVSLAKGDDRYRIIYQSLKQIEGEVLASIGDKRILLKPNIVLPKSPLSCTTTDAVRAVLDFLAPHYKKTIMIGESGAMNTAEGFKNYGYYDLKKDYDVEVVDLNTRTSFEYRYVLGLDNKPVPIRIISDFLDPDVYIISLARMKTHNYVVVTLSLKNVLLAAPLNDYKKNDKGLMHLAPATVNDLCHYNMFHLAQEVFPDLAVIDGFEGMEGNGPAWGTPILSKVALASLDPVACDTVGATIMGFDPKRINYLAAMAEAGMGQGDLGQMTLIGTPLAECLCKYKPNEKMAELHKFSPPSSPYPHPYP